MNKEKEGTVPLSYDIPCDFHPIIVGKICSSYGVLGWLKIISFTEKINNIMEYQPWYIRLFSEWRSVYLESWKIYLGNYHFIVKFKKIFNRDIAILLNNHEIFVDALEFPSLPLGEYYCKDILGCRVIGLNGYQFGIVVDLIETGSNDVLVIENNKYFIRHCFLIPIINQVMKNIDCLNRVISVDWDPTF